MYTQVYFHHARLIADKMFERAVKVAIRDGIIDKSRLNISDDDFINYYLSLDDDRLFQKILSNEKSNAYRLIDDLDNRRLMKAGYDVDINNLSEIGLKRKLASAKHDEEIENYIADKCGCNKDFIIAFSVEIDNPLYKSSNEFYKADKTPILIEFENGDIKEFDLVSPFELKKNSVIKFYILGLEKDKEKIVKASKNLGKDV
jgi:HD superfamily phosphohydrolase